MIDNLRPSSFSFNIKAEFYSARQRPDEDIDKFGHRLLRYINEVTPSEKALLEYDLIEVFRNGCVAEIRKFLTQSNTESFHEIWTIAQRIEKINYQIDDSNTLASVNEKETTSINF